MTSCQTNFLGTPHLLSDGKPITKLRSSKALVLLAYLMVENRPISRDQLAFLFWPDAPLADAKTELRRVLHSINRQLPNVLEATRLMIVPVVEAVSADIWRLEALVESDDVADWEQAVALVRGPFLDQMTVDDSAEMTTWLLIARERYQQLHTQLLHQLIAHYRENKQYDSAIAHARKRLSLDSWVEEAHADLMWLYAATGRRDAAISQYERCKVILAAELDVEPTTATQALYAEIVSRSGDSSGSAESAQTKHADLPAQRPIEQMVLIQKVQHFWIDGMLREAIGDGKLLTLPYEVVEGEIAHPWQKIVGGTGPKAEAKQQILGEYVASDRALLILGEPGAGKTTALIMLAQSLLEEAQQSESRPIPIILNLSSWATEWATEKADIEQWIISELVVRYQIPRKFGRSWLASNALTLLLDGLDEMSLADQTLCIEAINQFRAEHGLTGLAVCCRAADYATAQAQLQLGRAIQLEPLTPKVIDAYLKVCVSAELQQTIQQDDELIDLAKSPLMLNMLRVVLAEDDGAWLKQSEQGRSRSALLQSYVSHMFLRRGQDGPFSAEKTQHYLQCLAVGMAQHNQSTFLIEQLQPSWLAKRWHRFLYILATRLFVGAVTSVITGIFFFFGRITNDIPFTSFDRLASLFPFSTYASLAAVFFVVGAVHSSILALFDFLFFEKVRKLFPKGAPPSTWWISRAILFVVISFLVAFFPVASRNIPFAILGGIMSTSVFTLLLVKPGRVGYKQEIASVGTLGFSFRGSLRGLILGLPLILFIIFLGFSSFRILAILPILLGGVKRNPLQKTNRPNQGMAYAARNALLVSVPYGVILGVLYKNIQGPISLWLAILNFTFLVWTLFGGTDLVKHSILRLLLYADDAAPLQYASFLNYATSRALLRRVGGSYLFIHRLLLEHFVVSDPPLPFKEN